MAEFRHILALVVSERGLMGLDIPTILCRYLCIWPVPAISLSAHVDSREAPLWL